MYLSNNSFKALNPKSGYFPAFPESFLLNMGECLTWANLKNITLILKLTVFIIISGLEPKTLEIYFQLKTS